MKKNRTYRVNAFLMMMLAGTLSFSASAAVSESGLLPAAAAQQQPVKGTIVDVNGNPIPGASVMIPGTTTGAVTAVDGTFSLSVADGTKVEVGCLGYATVTVTAKNGMKVVLHEDAEALSEVVVVGYGTQKKANLTGAVSSVDVSKTLDAKPIASVGKALQGAVPGLTITSTSGNINDEPTIVIRGIGTLSNSGTSTPLYIVDGVPIDNISYLNPQDIANISVLKDAASASIYGTRAAFGVVMITTKSSNTTEKAVVSYTNNFGWSRAINLPDYPTVREQVMPFNDANKRMGQDCELFGMYTDGSDFLNAVDAWQKKHGGKAGYREMIAGDDYIFDKNGVANYVADWDVVGIMFNNATPSQNHTLSVQGTSGKTNYYMSLGAVKEQGLLNFNPDKTNKYTATVNVSSKIKDWLEIGARVNYSEKKYDYPYLRSNTYQYMWRWGSFFGPWGYIKDANGEQYECRQAIGFRKEAGDAYTKVHNLRIGGFTKIDITKGLSLNADYTYTYKTTRYKGVGIPAQGWNTWGGFKGVDKSTPGTIGSSTSFVETSRSFYTNYVANIYGNYALDLGDKNHFNFMAGFNADEDEYEYLYYENHDIMDYNLPELALTPTFYSYTQSHTHTGSAGFFGRINYNYADKILVELNGRYDGSSKFPQSSRWAFFPSASAGYRISQENFWTPIKHIVNNAKIRASYGEIGNQEIGNNMFLETMSKKSNNVNWLGTGKEKYSYFTMPSLVSADLTWETIATTNIGVDLGFLNGDLNATFDWFQRTTRDMLAPGQTMPSILGTTAAYENGGELRTRGWELTLDYHHMFENGLSIYAIGNISDYKTVITKWDNDSPQLNTRYSGKVYGEIWGFETDRYFTSDDDVKNSPSQKLLESGTFTYGPGDIKFKDLDGDNEITWGKGTEEDHGDLKVIGNITPRYQYSLRIGGAWKGFDLDMYFQGVGKRDYWSTSAFVIPFSRGTDAIYSTQTSYVSENDVKEGNIDQSKTYPRMFGGNGARGQMSSNIQEYGGKYNFYPQTRYLLNMSYLRLKNITVGYTIPQFITDRVSIDKVRVYVNVNNALDIINHTKKYGIDPEIGKGEGTSADAGAFGRTDPYYRTISCGVQITF